MTRPYAGRMRYQRVVHLVNPFDDGNKKVMAQIPQSDLIKMEAVYLQQEPSACTAHTHRHGGARLDAACSSHFDTHPSTHGDLAVMYLSL